jgi:UDP-N-acetylmuramoyl-L-alanyl-D-glutamate--2,6-diaminopimelate ligase
MELSDWNSWELLSEANLLKEGDFPKWKIRIDKITRDSRDVNTLSLFVAIPGTRTDGHHYLDDVIRSGCQVIVYSKAFQRVWPQHIIAIPVEDPAWTYGVLCSVFFGHPSKELSLVGVTGTNGKSSIVTLLHQLYSIKGEKVGLLSTIVNKIGDKEIPSTHTTPDSWELQGLLREMVNQGCQRAFMEVSSHAVDQQRIAGLMFKGAVFTNLTHDHLDYHKTFDAYLKAKKKFFDNLNSEAFALVNASEKHSLVMVQNTLATVKRYGLNGLADFEGRVLEDSLEGLLMKIDGQEVHLRLVGRYNAENAVAAYGVCCLLGWEKKEALYALSQLTGVSGRFEKIIGNLDKPIGIVDYAHTPDALEKVLRSIRASVVPHTKIICVVGCGGNRDVAKRPIMGKIATVLSDKAIFTSDNPREEDPSKIIEEMKLDLNTEEMAKVVTIVDRKEAIQVASLLAGKRDVILLAGKGHENYQEVMGKKLPFDDREILKQLLVAI